MCLPTQILVEAGMSELTEPLMTHMIDVVPNTTSHLQCWKGPVITSTTEPPVTDVCNEFAEELVKCSKNLPAAQV